MNRDLAIHFSIVTPGGYIIRMDLDDAPKAAIDLFRAVEEPTTIQMEKAVAYISWLTGCRCTIHRSEQITCEARSPAKTTA